MNVLPVFGRELRGAARRRSTYMSRTVMGLAGGGLGLGFLYNGLSGSTGAAEAGRMFFQWLSLMAFGFVLVDGVLVTCDSISRERREGTLNLLLLAPLTALDIVLAKCLTRTFELFYCLLAVVPMWAIAFILGGVSMGDFASMILAVMNALFFSAALGMFMSVTFKREVTLFLVSIIAALVWGALLPLAGAFYMDYCHDANMPVLCSVLGPCGPIMAVLWPSVAQAPNAINVYWVGTVVVHLEAWALLGLASFMLSQQTCEDALVNGRYSVWFKPIYLFRARKKAQMRMTDWWEINPVYRLTGLLRDRQSSQTRRYCLLAALFVLALMAYPRGWLVPDDGGGSGVPSSWFEPPVFPLAILALHLLLRISVASEACTILANERREGTLEMLLVSPLSEAQILRGYMVGLKRRYIIPFLIVQGLQWLMMAFAIFHLELYGMFMLAVIYAGLNTWLLVDLYLLSWIGLWQGLETGRPGKALRRTLAHVFVLPGCMFVIVLAIWQVTRLSLGIRSSDDAWVVLLPLGAVLASMLGSVTWAIASLYDRMRTVAAIPLSRHTRQGA